MVRLDLANQLNWVLTKALLPMGQLDESFLKTGYSYLQRMARRTGQRYYFVLDGVEDLPQGPQDSILTILHEILPLGLQPFKFLFSGDVSIYRSYIHSSMAIKSYPLTELSLDEASRLLVAVSEDRDVIREVHQVCRGSPGRVASLRRAIEAGTDVRQFLAESPTRRPELFALEWRQVRHDDEPLRKILSLLAHDSKPHTIETVSSTLEIPHEIVVQKIESVNFLLLDPEKKEISFASEPLRRFIAEKLRDMKPGIQKLLIKRLLSMPESDEAFLSLPQYLEEAAQFQDLLSFLTPDHIVQVLKRSQTLSRVHDAVRRGLATAKSLGRDGDLLRFGIQSSTISEFAAAAVWVSEVEALVALGEPAAALAIANNAVLKEDRLLLLAAVASTKYQRGELIEHELVDQLKLLCERIDRRSLGPKALQIATKLLCISPDLAIGLVERANEGTSDQAVLDRAFLHLSVMAANTLSDEVKSQEAIDRIVARRRDPRLELISQAYYILLGRQPATTVIGHVGKLEKPEARLALLRAWTMLNRRHPEAEIVVEHAIGLAVRTTSYSLDASALADLAAPLPFLRDSAKRQQLVGIFDGLRGNAERLGPSIGVVRLQIALAQAEWIFNGASAEHRLMELFDYAARVDELATKGECLALLLSAIKDIGQAHQLASHDSLERECGHELDAVLLHLIATTADHYLAARGIVSALVRSHPGRAIEYISLLNTEPRRDAALLHLVEAVLHAPATEIDPCVLKRLVETIGQRVTRDRALGAIAERLANEEQCPAHFVTGIVPLLAQMGQISDAVLCCNSCASAYRFLAVQGNIEHASLMGDLLCVLRSVWDSIDIGWIRVDVGFEIAKHLATACPNEARAYFQAVENLKDEFSITAYAPAAAYVTCIRLALRALSGLVHKRHEIVTDLETVASLINVLPSHGERAVLWADLCLRCCLQGRMDLVIKIGAEHLKPALSQIPERDAAYRSRVIAETAPALFKIHSATCLDLVATVDIPYRDLGYRNVIRFLLRNEIPSDSDEELATLDFEAPYESLVDVCEVLNRVESDWLIYHAAKTVADILTTRKRISRLNRSQRDDIARRLQELAATKLPTRRLISHLGYQIITNAQAHRIREAKVSEWEDLIARGRAVPNTADRALVLFTIAGALPKSQHGLRDLLMREARDLVLKVPSALDRIERFAGFAEDLYPVDVQQSRELLTLAVRDVAGAQEEVRSQQRKIVDLAYRIDKEFARKLIDTLDDDTAKKQAQSRIRLLELKQKVIDEKLPTGSLSELRSEEYSQLAWMLVRGLRSGRIQHYQFPYMRVFIEGAAAQRLKYAYPALVWIIENAISRYSETPHASTFIRPIFEATVIAAELAGQIAGRSLIQLRTVRQQATKPPTMTAHLVKSGTRESAMQALRSWFESNVKDFLKIIDPYFGPPDLEIVHMLQSVQPGCRVQILTGRRNQPTPPAGQTLEEYYGSYWKQHISDQTPPPAEIAIIGTASTGECPVHDRWIITKGAGVILGTSVNSIGLSKISDMVLMSPDDADIRLAEVDQLLSREKMEHNGERLKMNTFVL